MTDKNTGELNMISAGQKVNKLMQDFFTGKMSLILNVIMKSKRFYLNF